MLVQKKLRASDSNSGSGIASLLVSLYLVILSFFILLNTLSDTNEQKQDDVYRVMTETFSLSANKGSFGNRILNSSVPSPSSQMSGYLGATQKVVRSLFPLDEVRQSQQGNAFKVSFGMENFFDDGSQKKSEKAPKEAYEKHSISEAHKQFITRLAGNIGNFPGETIDIRINVLTEMGGDRSGFLSSKVLVRKRLQQQKLLAEMEVLMDHIAKYNFSGARLSVGLINDPGNRIDFVLKSKNQNPLTKSKDKEEKEEEQ
jgi:hypothetical protein